MNQRDLHLDGYGIGLRASRELRSLCEQYPFRGQLRAAEECQLIEQTAIEVDPEAYQPFLQAIVSDSPYEYCTVPRGRSQFYERRRRFFYLLARKKGII